MLSARAEGPPSDYPWLAIRARATPSVPTTPIARPGPKTPLTEVLPQRTPQPVFELTVLQASGARTLELAASALPATIGRSRDQTLVVDRQHEAVSGRHLEIVAFDDAGAQAVVHGDNGVVIEGVHHGVGAQVAWRFGDTMVLDAADANRPACWLTLVRSSDA